MHVYSTFWLDYGAGRRRLSPIWRDRPDPPLDVDEEAEGAELVHPAERIPLAAWCNQLTEGERNAIVAEYVPWARPRPLTGQRDRVEVLAS